MSRTLLGVITAGCLACLSVVMMVTRHSALGGDVHNPSGPSNWKIVLLVNGSSQGDAHVITTSPLEFGKQHVNREEHHSSQMTSKPDDKTLGRRQVIWSKRGGQPDGPFRVRSDYLVSIDVHHPSAGAVHVARGLAEGPKKGEHLDRESKSDTDQECITLTARKQTFGQENPTDVADSLYRFVAQEIQNEPGVAGSQASAADCLRAEGGDCAAKSRLLVALLRNRGIPARLVAGVILTKVAEQRAHTWVEAWIRERWLPMCPSQHYFGKVPANYLPFAYGDQPLVRGWHIRDLDYAFLVEHAPVRNAEGSALKRFFQAASLYSLPPSEQRLVEFLLLLPLASIIICVYRNLIGLNSFGLFAPALVGLAFRDLRSLPGFGVFVSILLIGWLMRRVLDSYRLLQVPRVALMLSLIVVVLILAVQMANYHDFPVTRYISLFPLIILTGMVERFWTLENEDSVGASFRTLLSTMLIAATISIFLSFKFIVRWMFAYPETLGLIMAGQLLIGRYTGYRLMELLRFRDFLQPPPSNELQLAGAK